MQVRMLFFRIGCHNVVWFVSHEFLNLLCELVPAASWCVSFMVCTWWFIICSTKTAENRFTVHSVYCVLLSGQIKGLWLYHIVLQQIQWGLSSVSSTWKKRHIQLYQLPPFICPDTHLLIKTHTFNPLATSLPPWSCCWCFALPFAVFHFYHFSAVKGTE